MRTISDTMRILALGAIVALPLASLQSQGRPGRSRAPAAPSAGELINARRALNLTPQQLVRLDSIERAQFSQRERAGTAARATRDSLCANRRPCVLSQDEIQRLRSSREGLGRNIFAADSTRRALTMNILDSTQRARYVSLRRQQGRNAASGANRASRNRSMIRGGRAERGRYNSFRGQRPGFRGPPAGFRGPQNRLRGQGIAPRRGPGQGMRQQGFRDQPDTGWRGPGPGMRRQGFRDQPDTGRRVPRPRRAGGEE